MVANLPHVEDSQIAEFCKRHGIRRLALFGSILRDDFNENSDVDVLVEFNPATIPGWEFFGMEDELAEIIGRKVDLNTPRFLGKHFRKRVLTEAQNLYVAA